MKTNFTSTLPIDDAKDYDYEDEITFHEELPDPELGQIVARGVMYFGACFRCVMDITCQGHFVVQDFGTSQGEKRTDPYVMTSKEAVYSTRFDFWEDAQAPIEGEYVAWSEHGQKCVQGVFQNNAKHGLWEYWSVDGQKVLEENYKNGLLDGVSTRWTYGSRAQQGHYALGKRHGAWREWWFNGVLSVQGNYYAGLCQGEWAWWRRDGLKKAQGRYHLGYKVGLWQSWDLQGKLKKKKNFDMQSVDLMDMLREEYRIVIDWDKTLAQDLLMRQRLSVGNCYDYNGLRYVREFLGITPEGHYVVQDYYTEGDEKFTDPYILLTKEAVFKKDFEFWSTPYWQVDGHYVQWHLGGGKRMEMNFEKGMRQGSQIIWDKQGGKESAKTFKDNKLNGFYCTWYPDGQIQEKRYYLNDLRAGLWVKWWANGQKQYQGSYQNDLLQGEWQWWFSSGAIKASGSYTDGFKVGLWQWWDENKQIMESHYYRVRGEDTAQWLEQEFDIILDEFPSERDVLEETRGEEVEGAYQIRVGYRFDVHDADFMNTYVRKFLGITTDGFSVVQDFYWEDGDRHRTQPYVLQDRHTSALMYCEANDIQRCGIVGKYTQWFARGGKEFEGCMKNGCPVGVWRWWNTSGLLLKEVDYGDGSQLGSAGQSKQTQTLHIISNAMKNTKKGS